MVHGTVSPQFTVGAFYGVSIPKMLHTVARWELARLSRFAVFRWGFFGRATLDYFGQIRSFRYFGGARDLADECYLACFGG